MQRFVLAAFAAAALGSAGPASAQDAAAGQRVYNQCHACHTIDEGGRHGVGPNLHGIVGQRAAQREGFRYSPIMRELAAGGLTWTEENLRRYIADPNDLVPRTTMIFPGIRDPQQLNDLIAFLKQNSPGS